MSRGSNPEKLKEWTDRLKRFDESQQTVSVFCRNERVSEPSFYHWKKKLLDMRTPSDGVRSQFRTVGVSTCLSLTGKEETVIQLGHGIQIELGNDLPVVKLVVRELFAATIEARSADVLPAPAFPGSRPGAKSC